MRPQLVFDHLILIFGAFVMCAPLVMAFLVTAQAPEGGYSLWAIFENYGDFLSTGKGFNGDVTVARMTWNSLVLAVGLGLLRVILSLMAAYALVMLRMPFSKAIFGLFVLSIMLPLESRFLPTYAVTAELNLINTHAGLILPVAATGIGIVFFRQFLKSMPPSLRESAALDGAGPWLFFRDMVVPLSMPMAKALFLVTFVSGWNQYLWPAIATTEEARATLVRGLQYFGSISLNGLMLICITTLPPALLVIVMQRDFVRGLYEGQN